MNIDDAIRVKEEEITKPLSHSFAAIDKADRLGIEALKRVKEARKKVYFTARSLLPGETED